MTKETIKQRDGTEDHLKGMVLNPVPQWRKKERLLGLMLVAPAFLILLTVIVYPLGMNLIMSFQLNILTRPHLGTPFIGFENYRRVLTDPIFWDSLRRSFIWVLSAVTIQVSLGLSAALLLNKSIRGRGIWRGIILIPWVTPGVVAALNWRWMLDGRMGIINRILVDVGILSSPIAWFGNFTWAFPAVIGAYSWKMFPFSMVMLLAALQTIPESLYEAARVDGANKIQQFFNVTLPEIMPTLSLTMLLTSIWTFNNFDTIWLLTEGGPSRATEILTTFVYKAAFQRFNMGYAAATSVIMFLILLTFVLVLGKRAIRRDDV